MPGHPGKRRLRYLGLAVYALFLLTAPFEHHDLICHLKTPQHCSACTSTQLGADPHRPLVPGAWHLGDAGCALAFQAAHDGVLLSARSSGRSPPVLV